MPPFLHHKSGIKTLSSPTILAGRAQECVGRGVAGACATVARATVPRRTCTNMQVLRHARSIYDPYISVSMNVYVHTCNRYTCDRFT
jgi:hypothetical protein